MFTALLGILKSIVFFALNFERNEPLPKAMSEKEQALLVPFMKTDLSARNRIIEGNMRIAASIAKKLSTQFPAEYNEFYATGLLALTKATEDYDPLKAKKKTRNGEPAAKFSTFAYKCVFNEVLGELNRTLRREKYTARPKSEIDKTEQENIINTYADPYDFVEELCQSNERTVLRQNLDKLDKTTRDIICLYYGISDDEKYKRYLGDNLTHEQIGKIIGVNRWTVTRRISSAIKKLPEFLSQDF